MAEQCDSGRRNEVRSGCVEHFDKASISLSDRNLMFAAKYLRFAAKLVKGLGLGSLGLFGILLMIVLGVILWGVGGLVAALFPAWILMLVAGAVGWHLAFTSVWLVLAVIFMLFGV